MRKPRKWAHPLAIEREYIRAVREYADLTNEGIRRYVLPVLDTLNLDAVEDIPESVGWYERLRLATLDALAFATAPTAGIAFLVRRFGQRIADFNGDQFRRVLRSGYGVDIFVREPALLDTLAVFEAENIKLIKSIPSQALDKMHGKIVAAVRRGTALKDIREMVENDYGSTRARAELIARDQTSKLNGQLTRERQTAAGISSYVWETSRDERVRETHRSNAGKTFEWDKPPIDTGHPGEDYQCRCTARAILPLLSDLQGLEFGA